MRRGEEAIGELDMNALAISNGNVWGSKRKYTAITDENVEGS